MFLKPLRVLFGLLGSLLAASCLLLGRLGAKSGGLGATFWALRCLLIFWSDFGSKKGAPREAFWEPKRNKKPTKRNH